MASAKEALRSLGHLIRARRNALALTQGQLGKRAGIVGKYVSEIERGTRDVPFSTLQAIVEDGLGAHLEIRFGATTGKPVQTPLPTAIEHVARAIAALPADKRSTVLTIVRTILRLV